MWKIAVPPLLNSFTVVTCERTSWNCSGRTPLASITVVRNRVWLRYAERRDLRGRDLRRDEADPRIQARSVLIGHRAPVEASLRVLKLQPCGALFFFSKTMKSCVASEPRYILILPGFNN